MHIEHRFKQNLVSFENFLNNVIDKEKYLMNNIEKNRYNEYIESLRFIFRRIIGDSNYGGYSSIIRCR